MLDGRKMWIARRRGRIFQDSEHWKMLKRGVISVKLQTVYLKDDIDIKPNQRIWAIFTGSSRQCIKYRDTRMPSNQGFVSTSQNLSGSLSSNAGRDL